MLKLDADDRFDEGVEESGEDVVLGLLEGVGEVVDCDGDLVDLEKRVVVRGGEIGGQFDFCGDSLFVHLQLSQPKEWEYVNIEKTFVLELKESSLLAERITDVPCSNTEFVNVNRGRVTVLGFKGIYTRELGMRIRINANFAGQEIIRLKNEILNDKVDIRVLILDPRNRNVSHQRHRLWKNHIDYNQHLSLPTRVYRNHARHQIFHPQW